jgi:hypothetical protein
MAYRCVKCKDRGVVFTALAGIPILMLLTAPFAFLYFLGTPNQHFGPHRYVLMGLAAVYGLLGAVGSIGLLVNPRSAWFRPCPRCGSTGNR